jgi:dihydrofolate synthase/folylpolyglutamate synthase
VTPSVAAITGVGLDHTAILGDTLEAIAAEKAAIIRPASAPVLGPGTVGVETVFLEGAETAGTHARAVRPSGAPSPVAEALTIRYALTARPSTPDGTTVVDVRGVHAVYSGLAVRAPSYQADNIATAVAIAEAALGRPLDVGAARSALSTVTFPGRFELMRTAPPVIVDGSHNPQAAAVLASAVQQAFPVGKPDVLLGVLADKDARGIVAALAPSVGSIAVAQPDSPRALPVAELAAIVEEVTGSAPLATYATIAEAIADSLCHLDAGLLITGSLTTAGQARRLLRETS